LAGEEVGVNDGHTAPRKKRRRSGFSHTHAACEAQSF
jgi:hypothetical protein